MTHGWMIVLWAMVWVVLFRALLVRADLLPKTCHRCGRPLERSRLGDEICSCS